MEWSLQDTVLPRDFKKIVSIAMCVLCMCVCKTFERLLGFCICYIHYLYVNKQLKIQPSIENVPSTFECLE